MKSTLEEIKPYIQKGTKVGSIVSSSGFFWTARDVLGGECQLYGFQRVPFISRVREYGRSATITGSRSIHKIGVSDNFESHHIIDFFRKILGAEVVVLQSYLEAALTNSNPILHPARLFALFEEWQESEVIHSVPLFYEDWDLKSSTNLVNADREFQCIIKELQIATEEIPPLLQYYGCINEEELTAKIRSIDAFKRIKTPMKAQDDGYIPDFTNRYFTEDIPYGLIIIKSLGLLLNKDTPTVDKIIFWAQKLMGKSYLKDQRTLGRDFVDSAGFQNFGVDRKERLFVI
jgi:hypothetical protein